MKKFVFVVLVLGISIMSGRVSSALTLNAVDRGYFSSDSRVSHGNTYTGYDSHWGVYTNSFFIFQLPEITSTVVSAELQLELESLQNPDPTHTFRIYDVSTFANEFSIDYDIGSIAGIEIYNDLGSGNTYGTTTVSGSNVGTILSIFLNNEALEDLNKNNDGFFAVGLSLLSLSPIDENCGVRFSSGATGDYLNRTHQLTLNVAPVPEPATMLLFGTGLASLVGSRLRRKKK